jgi:hypothetical protein
VAEAALFTHPRREQLDMAFQFEQLDFGAHGYDLREQELPAEEGADGRSAVGLADRGSSSLYLGNHDHLRAVFRFGDDGACRVASTNTLATVLSQPAIGTPRTPGSAYS